MKCTTVLLQRGLHTPPSPLLHHRAHRRSRAFRCKVRRGSWRIVLFVCLQYPAGVTSAWLQGQCCVMTINSHFGRRTGPEITARASFRRNVKAFTARVQARMNTPGAHQAVKRAIVCHSEKTALLECLQHLPIAVDEAWVDAAPSIVDDRVYCMSEQPHPSFHFVLEPLELALAPDDELAQIHKEHP